MLLLHSLYEFGIIIHDNNPTFKDSMFYLFSLFNRMDLQ